MESRYEERFSSLGACMTAISSGQVTREELVAQIEKAVRIEEEKPYEHRDYELITKLEKLGYELRTSHVYASRKEESLRQIKARLIADGEQAKPYVRRFKRLTIVLAAMLVLIIGAEVFLHRAWLFGKPSKDGQRYIIQGMNIDPGIIVDGQADMDDAFERITTKNLDNIVIMLGYKPKLPTWLPSGWKLRTYYAQRFETMTWFVASYENASAETLLNYEERRYLNANRARAEMEQDDIGEKINVSGKSVYFRTNIYSASIVWTDELVLRNVVGPLDKETLIRIQESIQKE